MEQNIGKPSGRDSKIPLFPLAEGHQKSRIARAYMPKSQEDVNNERMECEALNKVRPVNDATSEYWHNMVGQKVCIGGIKKGILRYYGKTQFANGIWCGVELDEPVGKNDGTVDGVHYFSCEQNYGIFAPVSKVEKMSLEETSGIPNLKSKLPAPKITAKNLISRISGQHHVHSSEDILYEKQDENRMSNFQCYGKRSKISSSTSDDSNINKLTGTNSEKLLDMEDSSECTSDESPEHLAKRSRLSTETKSQNLDSTFNLQESLLKQTVSSSSLKEVKNGKDLNSTFNISSPMLTECDKIDNVPIDRDSFDKTLSLNELLCKKDGTFVVESTSASLLERYSSCEDDQISLDLDESLGILTPNQMKDFTICLDTQNSEVIDLETLNIPNSESCDDINEIPEYEEIQGITVEYTPERNSSVHVSLLKLSSSNEDCTIINSVEECVKTPIRTFHKYIDSTPSTLLDKEMEKLRRDIDIAACSEITMYEKPSILDHTLSNTELNNKHHMCVRSYLTPVEIDNSVNDGNPTEGSQVEGILLEKAISDNKKEYLNGRCLNIALKEKISSDSYFELDNEGHNTGDLKDNRPISLHTLESTDTGYQEDAGFDNRSEQGDICEDVNRASVCSLESCIVLRETEAKNDNNRMVTDSGIVLSGEGDEIFRPNIETHVSISSSVQTEPSTLSLQEKTNTEQKQLNTKKVDVTEFNKLERWPMEASDESCHMFEKAISSSEETAKNYLLPEQNSCINAGIDIKNEELVVKEANEVIVDNAVVTNNNYYCTVPANSPSNLISEKLDNAMTMKSEQATPKKEKMQKTQEKVVDTSNNKNRSKTPKKNVISKIKAMIEATTSKTKAKDTEQAKKSAVKKGRWDAVTSKIAAGLAEEKSKPKSKKEIKSRIDTNLSGARQMSTKRNVGGDFTKGSSSFGNDNASESSLTMRNTFDHQRSVDLSVGSATGSVGKSSIDGSQAKDRRQTVNTSNATRLQKKGSRPASPLIGISQRSSSPLPPSECSTVSDTSKRVTVKQNFQGSNSTLASTSSNNQKKTVVSSTARKPTSVSTLQKKVPPKIKPKTSQPPSHGKYGGHAQTQAPPVWSTRVELAQEIQRLGTLCEARTKELNHMKMNFRHASLGFDAFVVLFQYLTDELDAFSQPRIVLELEKTHAALEEAEAHLHQYQREFEEIKAKHSQELCKLEKELNQSHQETIENLNLNHTAEIKELMHSHEKQLAELTESHIKQCQEMEETHSVALLELKNEHCLQIEELKIFHADQLEAIENSHHETRMELNSQLKELEQQCKDLKHQAKLVEEALQRDTDTKIQWISAKKADLEKEVDSLKTVLDMRRSEIHSLRKENLEMKKELEKLPVAKEKIKMLEAKTEDLQALVNQKIQLERQLSSDHQSLKENYEKESKVNTRLSMENEELMWKLKQNAEANLFLSSFSGASEAVEKSLSPLKSPSKQSASLPMFFHSMENNVADNEKMSLPVSSNTVTPCKKLPPLSRKCSSPIRTPSFVGASPPGPCSRKCKLDQKVAASPRKQRHKSLSSDKKLPSREVSGISNQNPADSATLKESLQHSRFSSEESCTCSKSSTFSTSLNGVSGIEAQPDCLAGMDHNEVLFNMLDGSNGSSNEDMCSREIDDSDMPLNFEHYNMLITNQMLSRKYKELTHLEKGREYRPEFEDSSHGSLVSTSINDNLSLADPQNMNESDESSNGIPSKDFTFDEQHFAENQPQECPSFPHNFDHSFHKKSESWTISSLCSNAKESVVNTLAHTNCDSSQSHQQPESSPILVEAHPQTIPPSNGKNCSHPLQPTFSQERNRIVSDSNKDVTGDGSS